MTEANKERLAKLMEAEMDDFGPFRVGLATAVKIIREQPAEPAWIAVEDRLPDVEGKVLVHCRSADPDSPLITTAWYHPEEGEWTLMAAYWIPAISHWMPLPPPPA
jgi:hypothetical protein